MFHILMPSQFNILTHVKGIRLRLDTNFTLPFKGFLFGGHYFHSRLQKDPYFYCLWSSSWFQRGSTVRGSSRKW